MEIFKRVALILGGFLVSYDFLTTSAFAQEIPITTSTTTTVSNFNPGVLVDTTVADVGSGDGSIILGTVDQSQTSGNVKERFDDTGDDAGTAGWVAQTFLAGVSGALTKVTLSLDRNNSSNTDGDVFLELRATSGGVPTTLIVSTSVPASRLAKNTQQDVDFIFSPLPSIALGTTYALVVHRGGSGTITADYNLFRGPFGQDQYPNGSLYTLSNGGAWTQQTLANPGTGDLRFSAFVSPTTSGTYSSDVLNTNFPGTEFSELSWIETLPTATDITFGVRASRTTFSKTDASPSWIFLGSANSPINLNGVLISQYQYFQWRATLTGSATATPTLESVTVSYRLPATISGESQSVPSSTDIVITWTTDRSTSTRLVYDRVSHPILGDPPNYGYAFSTSTFDTDSKVTSHSVRISGLADGVDYYYRTISEGSPVAVGQEGSFRTLTPAGPPSAPSGPAPTTGVVLGVSTVPTPKPQLARKPKPKPSPLPLEKQKEQEVKGEETHPTPITPSPLTLLFEGIGGLLAGVLGFFTRLFGK